MYRCRWRLVRRLNRVQVDIAERQLYFRPRIGAAKEALATALDATGRNGGRLDRGCIELVDGLPSSR